MEKLVDILRNASDRRDLARLGVLDSGIFESLALLSSNVHFDGMENGRPKTISSYQEALENLAAGLDDGYKNAAKPADRNKYYDHGYYVGRSAKERIDSAIDTKDVQALSSKRLMEQWRGVIPIMQDELKVLAQAHQDLYQFLLSYIDTHNDGFSDIAEGLTLLFAQHEALVRHLLLGQLSDDFVRNHEHKSEPSPEDHAQLGIVYLFRGEISGAKHNFTQAEPSYNKLEHVAGRILKAYTIFMYANSRARLARKFDLEVVKV